MSFIKKNILIVIIIIFHLIGFIGFMMNPVYFKPLSPVNLLLSTVLVLMASSQTNWKFYGAILSVAISGFLIEVIGVKTGLIFGVYHYGNSLGYKVFGVPLLIGINWGVLLYSTSQLSKIKNTLLNALLGAFYMVALDFFIEQNAAKFDFWHWNLGIIPLQNYIAWFFISFILNLLSQKQFVQKPNNTAKAFYIVQIIFFAALYWFN